MHQTIVGRTADEDVENADAPFLTINEKCSQAAADTPRPAKSRVWTMLASLLVFLVFVSLPFARTVGSCMQRMVDDASDLTTRSLPLLPRAKKDKALQEDFQVYPPVLTVDADGVLEITDGSSNASVEVIPSSTTTCQQTLVVHSFAYSYGTPYVVEYTPPDCDFDRVSWNITVNVSGVQFDRLGTVWLGNIEVYRFSTAEPTAKGIFWTYIKDMTPFLYLFKKNDKLIFELDNIVEGVYDGIYNVTLTASYFTAGDSITPADLILPVSTRSAAENQSSLFTVNPGIASDKLKFPRHTKRAVFTIAATGQIDEEFWWSNVPESVVDTFGAGELGGYSPFREVQLYIDGTLAGVAWPWPIIFTGGVVPGLWRPIVGIDAFDLKEDEIDITPWLPVLCDGKHHNFTIRVSGLDNNGDDVYLSNTTDGYWLVSGKAFIWLDEDGHITTGTGPTLDFPTPTFTITTEVSALPNGTNETLIYNVAAHRQLSATAKLKLSSGEKDVYWKQNLNYTNFGNYSDEGYIETNEQHTTGYQVSSSGYASEIDYPLYAYSIEFENKKGELVLDATIERSKNVKTLGQPVFPTGLESFAVATAFHDKYADYEGASLATTQHGHATYIANLTSDTAVSYGTTWQNMTFSGLEVVSTSDKSSFPTVTGNDELFTRYAKAVHSHVTIDEETLLDTPIGHDYATDDDATTAESDGFAAVRRLPGRDSLPQRRRKF